MKLEEWKKFADDGGRKARHHQFLTDSSAWSGWSLD
jgi:hypothetical protein